MTISTTDLYARMAALDAQGDTAGAIALMREHLNELPDEVKSTILLGMTAQGVQDMLASEDLSQEIQKKSIEALDTLEETQSSLKK